MKYSQFSFEYYKIRSIVSFLSDRRLKRWNRSLLAMFLLYDLTRKSYVIQY